MLHLPAQMVVVPAALTLAVNGQAFIKKVEVLVNFHTLSQLSVIKMVAFTV